MKILQFAMRIHIVIKCSKAVCPFQRVVHQTNSDTLGTEESHMGIMNCLKSVMEQTIMLYFDENIDCSA